MIPRILNFIDHYVLTLSALGKFSIALVMIIFVPRLCRRVHVPPAVGLLLGGVIVGPNVLGIANNDHPIADFLGDLGKLFLMFFAGLDIDLALFRRTQKRSIGFGIATTVVPLVFGTAVGFALGYTTIPAIVIGSLLASHTLLGLPVVDRLGLQSLEPVTVAVGATVISDTLSLVVFAVCLSIYTTGFSPSGLALQLTEIVGYVLFVLFVLSYFGGYALSRVEHEEEAYFILMLCFMAVAGVLADAIELPGIVGAFLAGLAINASARDKPASAKLEFLGKSLFIPIFFISTGFLVNPVTFFHGIVENFPMVGGIIGALLAGKWIAAWIASRWFGYTKDEQRTVWSLTLPQVAATLAATLVAYQTLGPGGQRLLDAEMLNAVLVMMVVTSIVGPVLTERFGIRLVAAFKAPSVQTSAVGAGG
jgi:Kef-type K+ transport system membrane component KefB